MRAKVSIVLEIEIGKEEVCSLYEELCSIKNIK
jgi:hypothetical protein